MRLGIDSVTVIRTAVWVALLGSVWAPAQELREKISGGGLVEAAPEATPHNQESEKTIGGPRESTPAAEGVPGQRGPSDVRGDRRTVDDAERERLRQVWHEEASDYTPDTDRSGIKETAAPAATPVPIVVPAADAGLPADDHAGPSVPREPDHEPAPDAAEVGSGEAPARGAEAPGAETAARPGMAADSAPAVDPPPRRGRPIGDERGSPVGSHSGGPWFFAGIVLLLCGGVVFWGFRRRGAVRQASEPFTIVPVFFDNDAEKVAIFGDVHGNLQALEAVLADIRKQGISQCVCTGDIVGYGANPDECVDVVAGLGCPVVVGNHDKYCSGTDELARFNPEASKSVFWTRGRLTEDRKAWLRGLPYVLNYDNFTVVHSNLFNPENWEYVLKAGDAEVAFAAQEHRICFIGHSHVPMVFTQTDGTVGAADPAAVTIEEGTQYIINVGSVGQPRDGNPGACYAIYDRSAAKVWLRRVLYAMEAAQERIWAEGLPRKNADRLSAAR